MELDLELLPPPDDLRAELALASSLGVTLYHHDLVSALGTDVMRANVPAPRELGIAGYLTQRDTADDGCLLDTWQVMFFSAGDAPHELCRVRVPTRDDAKPVFTRSEPPTPVPDFERQLIRARQAALAAIEPIEQPQNPVVLLGITDDKPCIVVYLLAGSNRNDVVVFGKHHRVLMSSNGETVIRVEPLTRSFLEQPLETPGLGPRWVPGPFHVSHLVTPWPLETHVFLSLLHRTPIVVSTSIGVWLVDGPKISMVKLPPSEPAPAPATVKTSPPSLAPSTRASPPPAVRSAPKASDTPPIEPLPRFNAILSRKPWWRFW